MRSTMEAVIKSIAEFFGRLSKKQRTRLIMLAVFVAALSVIIALILGRVSYSVLYSGLSPAEAGEIVAVLQEMGVPVKTEGTGTVLVPDDRANELRMRLSADGFQSGDYNYDIFAQASGFGTTDLEKQTYLQYQLQANIRTYILKMEKIKDCLVLLSLPKESSFLVPTTSQEASASVLVEVRSGATLSRAEAGAIAETVMAGVPGLKLENIRLVDSKMNLYSLSGADSLGAEVSEHFQLEDQVRVQLEEQVLNLLSPVFGADAVKASVSVSLNFDDKISESVEFAPPVAGETDGIVVSMSELYENARGDGVATGIPGSDTNGLGTTEYPYGELADGELYNKVLREINYEINRTTTQIQEAKGSIKTLSIAVLLNSDAIEEDYTSNVINLVAKAIGVREDYISVERLPFLFTGDTISAELEAQQQFMNSMKMKEIIRTVIICVTALLLAFALVSLIRTILNDVMEMKKARLAFAGGVGGNVDYLAEEDSAPLKDIDLRAKSESMVQIENFIEKDPKAVAQLLRNWLSDE